MHRNHASIQIKAITENRNRKHLSPENKRFHRISPSKHSSGFSGGRYRGSGLMGYPAAMPVPHNLYRPPLSVDDDVK